MHSAIKTLLLALILAAALTPEEECSPTDTQLRLYGYQSKAYNILTEDGYILSLFRIVANGSSKAQEPIIFVHGVLSSSDCFFANGTHNPPFYFVEKGYDVWLANVRGSQYGQRHLMYDYKDPMFWNFTFEEIGTYDIKASIEFILHSILVASAYNL